MKKLLILSLSMILAFGLAACSGSNTGAGGSEYEDYPNDSIELVAAGSAGGGLDLMARSINKGVKDAGLQDQPFVIKNMGGGGGNPARAYMAEQEGDPYYLLTESNRVYMNNIVGTTELGLDDVTPIARMATEYQAWIVRANSEYTKATQILDKLKEDPNSVQFGVGTVPSDDQLNIIRPAKQYGIDPSKVEIVVFDSGGNLMTQLLGGHIDVISTGISEALGQVRAGKARILAVSSPEPLPGELSDAPTWKSMGIDVEILHWRGVFGPPNMPEEAVAYWDKKFGALVKSKAWQAILEKNKWFDSYLDSAAFKKSLQEERDETAELLQDVGLAK